MIANNKTARTFDNMQRSFDWVSSDYQSQVDYMQKIIDFLLSVKGSTVLIDWHYTDPFTGYKSVETVNDKLDQINRRINTFKRMINAINKG